MKFSSDTLCAFDFRCYLFKLCSWDPDVRAGKVRSAGSLCLRVARNVNYGKRKEAHLEIIFEGCQLGKVRIKHVKEVAKERKCFLLFID